MDDSTEDTMSPDPDDNDNTEHDVEALLERVDEKDDRIETLEAELEAKEDEITEVKRSYAAALAEHDPVNDEEDYVEKFDVAELRERYDALDEDLATDPEPDVQSGGGTSGSDETAELSDLDEETQAELRDRKEKYEHWRGKNETIAEAEADKIAELAGVDSVDEVNLEAI